MGVALSLGLSAWFLHSVEWSALGDALSQVSLGPVVLACALLLGEFVLRALRWKVLLRPVAPEAKVQDLFVATVIGATANTLLPARAGELAKPLVASRKTGASFTAVLATTVMERVYDIFGLLAVLTTMVLVLPVDVGETPDEAELVRNLKLYGALFGAFAFGCMFTFFGLASRGADARRVFVRITSIAPAPVANKFNDLFDGFVQGLGNARDLSGMWKAGGLSLAIWFNGAFAIYVLFAAFDLDLPIGAACFTAVASALTVALPQAPGFFGVFHVAIEKTLVLWAVDPTPAKAFAIVFWGVSFLPVTLVGLLALWREGLTLGGIWSRTDEENP